MALPNVTPHCYCWFTPFFIFQSQTNYSSFSIFFYLLSWYEKWWQNISFPFAWNDKFKWVVILCVLCVPTINFLWAEIPFSERNKTFANLVINELKHFKQADKVKEREWESVREWEKSDSTLSASTISNPASRS